MFVCNYIYTYLLSYIIYLLRLILLCSDSVEVKTGVGRPSDSKSLLSWVRAESAWLSPKTVDLALESVGGYIRTKGK